MKKVIKAFSLLKNHPDLFVKRLISEIRALLPLPRHPVIKKINEVLFEFDCAYDSSIRDMYLGKYEIREIKTMKKILHKGDTFIDVGANIGYFSAVAAGLVGKTGMVYSFEPVPEYFQKLQKFAVLNPNYKIIVNQFALGEVESKARIAVSNISNIGWNTIVPGFMKPEDTKQSIDVTVRRLDNYIKEHQLNNIALIKIDVEGFEFLVLKGLKNFFMNTCSLPPILCEIVPPAYSLLGYQITDLLNYMKEFSYYPYDFNNPNGELDYFYLKNSPLTNVLFKHI